MLVELLPLAVLAPDLPPSHPPAHIVQLLQEMRRVEVQRAAELAAPAAPGRLSQQQQWEAAAAGAHLGRSQSETRRGGRRAGAGGRSGG
jgi:hypothetical protein